MSVNFEEVVLRLVANGLPVSEAWQLQHGHEAKYCALAGVGPDQAAGPPRTLFDEVVGTPALLEGHEANVTRLLPMLAIALGVPGALERVPQDVCAALAPALHHVVGLHRRVRTGDVRCVQRMLRDARSAGCALAFARG